jgi:hypothetical protein
MAKKEEQTTDVTADVAVEIVPSLTPQQQVVEEIFSEYFTGIGMPESVLYRINAAKAALKARL